MVLYVRVAIVKIIKVLRYTLATMLYIYNTLTRQKEQFRPILPQKVGIYVCGMTVYDVCHLGHGRIFICFDMVVRYLRSLGYTVTYVRNITDIDDKIIKRSQELNISYQDLVAQTIAAMQADEAALGIVPPNFTPRVSEHIPQIIEMIQLLLDKNYAYQTASGDIYYDITKFTRYGELAHQDLLSLQAGARVEIDSNKKHSLDFVLWKSAKPNEPHWPSPWGNGRPGWHIECSALAKHYLGNHIDIHGGGSDLQFPHHQNELAQSEAANGSKFVNFWLHAGFVQVDKTKMSKSLGNFSTIKEILQNYHPEVLRYFLLASHYRSPVNYSNENLLHAQAALEKLYLAIRGLNPSTDAAGEANGKYLHDFRAAMNDDFNSPQAFAVLFDLAHEINRVRQANELSKAKALAQTLIDLGAIFGILQTNPEEFLCTKLDAQQIAILIAQRNIARQNRNWAGADKIRDELAKMGVIIEDGANGTSWRKNCDQS